MQSPHSAPMRRQWHRAVQDSGKDDKDGMNDMSDKNGKLVCTEFNGAEQPKRCGGHPLGTGKAEESDAVLVGAWTARASLSAGFAPWKPSKPALCACRRPLNCASAGLPIGCSLPLRKNTPADRSFLHKTSAMLLNYQ